METGKSVDYEGLLAVMEEQRADLATKLSGLDSAIAYLKNQLGKPVGQSESTPTDSPKITRTGHTNIATDTFFGMSIADAVKKYLGMVRKSQTVQEICTALEAGGFAHTSKSFYATVFTAINRRWGDQGDIVRVKRGVWGLAEWYPGLKKGKKQEEGKPDQPSKPTPA